MLEVIDASLDVFNAKGSEKADGEISQRRHILRTMGSADRRAVFAKGKIFSVMQFVFNVPIVTLKFGKPFSIKFGKVDVSDEIYILRTFLAAL